MRLLAIVAAILSGCTTMGYKKCSDVVADFYISGSDFSLNMIPPVSHPYFGTVFALSEEKTNVVHFLCMIPPRTNMNKFGCKDRGDIKETCQQPNGDIMFYTEVVIDSQKTNQQK